MLTPTTISRVCGVEGCPAREAPCSRHDQWGDVVPLRGRSAWEGILELVPRLVQAIGETGVILPETATLHLTVPGPGHDYLWPYHPMVGVKLWVDRAGTGATTAQPIGRLLDVLKSQIPPETPEQGE